MGGKRPLMERMDTFERKLHYKGPYQRPRNFINEFY